jgi:acid phosphatase
MLRLMRLAAVIFGGFLLAATVPPLAADNCQERVHKAEEKLKREIDRHGEHSKQANRARHHFDKERSNCPTHHIFVIAEENEDYNDVIGSSNAPYINKTLVPMGTVWNNVYANLHGSLYDYILATSGVVPSQCTGNDCKSPITQDSIMQALQKNGMTWKGYMEDMPSCGYFAPQSHNWSYKGYLQRHNPFPWYAVGIANPNTWCPYNDFAGDLGSHAVANFNWITPNALNEMHGDGKESQPQLVAAGDAWLSNNVPQILNSSYFQPGGDGILIIWWDEGQEVSYYDGTCSSAGGTTCGGHIPMIVIGPNIKVNNVDDTYNEQQGVLRFFIQQLGLTDFMGASATANNFTNTTTTPIPRQKHRE